MSAAERARQGRRAKPRGSRSPSALAALPPGGSYRQVPYRSNAHTALMFSSLALRRLTAGERNMTDLDNFWSDLDDVLMAID
jgi:hypothetical protein